MMPSLLPIFAAFFICSCSALEASLYSTCKEPHYCGASIYPVKYPFGITKGCGHPDFQIECAYGNFYVLTIKKPKQRFSMWNVIYEEQVIHISYEKAFDPCFLPDANVDLTGSPFQLVRPYSNLTVLLNCRSGPINNNFTRRGCDKNYSSYLGFADPKFIPDRSKACLSAFEIPTRKVEPDELRRRDLNISALYSFLMIQGFGIRWDTDVNRDAICTGCQSSKGICGYNVSDPKAAFLCHCRNGSHSRTCTDRGGSSCAGVIIGVCIAVGIAMVVAAALLIAIRLRKRRWGSTYMPSRRSRSDFRFGESEMSNLAAFSYRELEEATNFFEENRLLGDGGFGSVYQGNLRDGRAVAVKRLHGDNSRRAEHFVNEVRIMASVRHFNLVRLFGFCHEDRRNLLLVYEYVPNGTLADHLHGKQKGKGLPWEIRLNIALEVAEALAFLHFCVEPPILHRDVKSTNILLDENLRVKVSDFGLSRLLPLEATHVSTVPQGTPGYLDPDYHRSYQLTDKSDVYSFGVVLLEIISAQKAVDISRDRNEVGLAHLAISKIQNGTLHDLVDPDLDIESNRTVRSMVTSVAELAFRCLALQKDDRPCMMEVVSQIQLIKQMGYGCQNCQKSFGSSRESFKSISSMPPLIRSPIPAMVLGTSSSWTESSA